MGNKGNKSNIKRESKRKKEDEEKEKFKNSQMNVYICGKYNKIMEILIAEKNNNDIISSRYEQDIDGIIIEKKNKEEKIILKDNAEYESNIINIKENLINKTEQIKDYSKDIDESIDINKYFNELKFHKDNIICRNEYHITNQIFNWNLYFYCENGFDSNSLELINQKINNNLEFDIKNTIILFIDSIEQIYLAIKIFSKIIKDLQPLFLFIIQNTTEIIPIEQFYSKIKDYVIKNVEYTFNIRNISIINDINLNEINESNFMKLYLYLIKAWLYYNNLGDDFTFNKFLNEKNLKLLLNDIDGENIYLGDKHNKSVGLFNILILGRAGSGKSTLVNLLSDSKRSLEGKGFLVTKYIIRYIIKRYNISLYDSPGFILDKDIDKIKILIEDLNGHLKKAKNQIHLVFYLINGVGARDFYDNERNILNLLFKNNIAIFFLITFSPNLKKGNYFKEVIESDLKKIFKNFDREKGLKYYKDQVKVFPVHLLDEDDGECNNFGLKTVLNAAFSKFGKCIINEEDLLKLENNLTYKNNDFSSGIDIKKKEIIEILNKNDNLLYKYIKNIDDIITSAKNESENYINSYSFYSAFLGIFGFFTSSLLKGIKKNILLYLGERYNKVINEDEKDYLIEENLQKINENEIQNNIPLVSTVGNYLNVKDFGEFYINKFSEELKGEGLEGISNYLLDLVKSYNTSIFGLKELSNYFNE